MTVRELHDMTHVVKPVRCELCRNAVALERKDLCGPCFVDFQAAGDEGVELKREDFEADVFMASIRGVG